MMTRDEENQILEDVRNGDRRALDRLLRAHYSGLYMLSLKYSRNPEVAADAVQETCASVIQHIDNFRGQSRFFSWAARITINHVRMFQRKSKRLVPVADVPEPGNEASGRRPDLEADSRQRCTLVEDYLRSRPNAEHQLFHRLYVAGESVRGVSEATGVSESAIKTRIHRARGRLKEHLTALDAWVAEPGNARRAQRQFRVHVR